MKLIIGLGNPDKKHLKNRHNIGFMVLDHFAQKHNLKFIKNSESQSFLTEIRNPKSKIRNLLLKPQTYMNNSGNTVKKIAEFNKITLDNILVIYDDIDLEFGIVRLRKGGSSAGHRGVDSIIKAVGSGFWRIRVGVSNSIKGHSDAADFVLDNFNKDEMGQLNKIFDISDLQISKFTSGKLKPETFQFG